jgi:hypothetical protein
MSVPTKRPQHFPWLFPLRPLFFPSFI